MRRRWVKLYTQTLRSAFWEEALEVRLAFIGLLLLAGDSPWEGKIQVAEGVGFTIEQLSKILRIPQQDLERAFDRLKALEMIKIKEGVIEVVNWSEYQSSTSTERVRRWRERKAKEQKSEFDSMPEKEKKEKVNALIDEVVKEMREEGVNIRLVSRTRIKMFNVLYDLAKMEGSLEGGRSLLLKAWKRYIETGKKDRGDWGKWVREKNFSLAYFLSTLQYWIDRAMGVEGYGGVAHVSQSFDDWRKK